MRVPPTIEGLRRAADVLRDGGLVAFPTETVYGLGARADSAAAVRAIYATKGRPAENPSIVHVASASAAFALAANVSPAARALAARFWPGPLTLVLEAQPGAIAREVTAGGSTVALRVPAHPIARALLEEVALPIAAPSANRSTAISPTTPEHVEKSLGVDTLVIDGGPTGFGIESTIVDATRTPLVVLRRGSVTLEDLATVADVLDRGDAVVAEGERAAAPGTMARHYAPRVPLTIAAADTLVADSEAGLVHRGGAAAPSGFARTITLPDDPRGYASGLYAALHALEDAGVARIFVEAVPEDAAWAAVRDRLTRAAR